MGGTQFEWSNAAYPDSPPKPASIKKLIFVAYFKLSYALLSNPPVPHLRFSIGLEGSRGVVYDCGLKTWE